MTALTFTFSNTGDFAAWHDALSFLRARGFSVGALQSNDPVGILFGPNILVAKWRNLNSSHRAQLHGTITATDMRAGPVTVEIFANAPAAARAAVSSRAA